MSETKGLAPAVAVQPFVRPMCFVIDDGERHWYIAESSAKALEQHVEMYSFGSVREWREDYPWGTVQAVNDDEDLTIRDDDEGTKTTMKVKEWIERCGIGFLASTVF